MAREKRWVTVTPRVGFPPRPNVDPPPRPAHDLFGLARRTGTTPTCRLSTSYDAASTSDGSAFGRGNERRIGTGENGGMSTRPRVRAPELRGRAWLNTEGDVSLRGLRGRFVLLDFWAFCCVNCLHVIDELRPLEERFADELVVVGVHSPKFVHEADPRALAQAVERYSVHHAVLDDPELVTWQAYTARAWPTLVLVDPEGYVVAQYAGEGHVHAIAALLGELVEEHRARGTLQPGDSPYVAPPVEPTDLRFPAKAVPLPGGGALVADAGHDEVVELAAAGEVAAALRGVPRAQRPVPAAGRRRGAGGVRRRGRRHRPPPAARDHPRDRRGARARRRRRTSGCRATARTGCPRPGTSRGGGTGSGSRWPASTSCGPSTPAPGRAEVAAGTTNEGLVDGPAAEAWFAQTSGLAPDGDRLWLADSETSSVRRLDAGPDGLVVAYRRGHRTVRLRLPRRRGRAGAAPAPARRHRAARRLAGGVRHLQRRGPAAGPRVRRGHHARGGPGRAERGVRRGRPAGGRRVRRPPADPAAARGRRGPHRRVRAPHAAPGHRRRGLAGAGRLLRAAAGTEGRRPLRPARPS